MGKIAAQEVCKMEKKHPNNLQEMRKRAGYKSAEAFAKYMGIPYGTYRNYEQGVRSMSLTQAAEFADALGCTIDEIAGHDTTNSRTIEEVIADLRAMNEEGREAAANAVRGMSMLPNYKKSSQHGMVEEKKIS